MTFGSLFAGIGGFDLGFERAGVRCVWQVENDRQAGSVLKRHWPDVPLHEDVRMVGKKILETVDVVCGGFPCQDLSVAGKREGIGGQRSGLFWQMLRIVDELQPRFLVWENVDGLLTSFTATEPAPSADEGREWEVEETSDFETVLRGLAGIGFYGACRVLDAQFFGVAQRRNRVFGVFARGDAGAERCAEVLALSESVRRHPAKGKKAGRRSAEGSCRSSGKRGIPAVSPALKSRDGKGPSSDGDGDGAPLIPFQCHGSSVGPMGTIRKGNGNASGGVPFLAHTLRAEGFDASEDGTGRGTPLVAFNASDYANGQFEEDTTARPVTTSADRSRAAPIVDFSCKDAAADAGEVSPTLRAMGHDKSHANAGGQVAVFQTRIARNGRGQPKPTVDALTSSEGGSHADSKPHIFGGGMGVRRLTPRECERLQGFPDDWTRYDHTGKEMSDGPRYRMIGNAVVVSVSEWIGRRIMNLKPVMD